MRSFYLYNKISLYFYNKLMC